MHDSSVLRYFLEVSCLWLLFCRLRVDALAEDGPIRLIFELSGTEEAEGEIYRIINIMCMVCDTKFLTGSSDQCYTDVQLKILSRVMF
jgi:hypothetical protein